MQMDVRTMLKRARARTHKSKREFKHDLYPIWSNFLTYNATPVCHFHHARRADHSRFRVELLGPSSTTVGEKLSNQGRATVEEHYESEGTLGPTHLQRPPWTDTFDDPHQTYWGRWPLEITVWYPNAAALAHEIHNPRSSWHAPESE